VIRYVVGAGVSTHGARAGGPTSSMASEPQPPVPCPRCNQVMEATTVRTTFWQGERAAIVEDVPAHVCRNCMEQFYDDHVSEALRRLAEAGFPAAQADKEVLVPVFSLEKRIRRPAPMPDDTYVD
jgi:YgiT-type zinc finger domain-containing protein